MTRSTETPRGTMVREVPANYERRFLLGRVAQQVRGEGDTQKRVIAGLGIVYNSETVIGGDRYGFREVIVPGAFTKSLGADDQRAFFNHDVNLILGRRSAETLKLTEDEQGVHYEIDPPNTSYANDLLESLARKDVTGSSFMFCINRYEWVEAPEGSTDLPLCRILEGDLFELGPVTFPAYEASEASVGMRSKAKELHEQRAQRLAKPPEPTADEIGAVLARAKAAELAVRIASL